jgi:protein-disulfide isomerase
MADNPIENPHEKDRTSEATPHAPIRSALRCRSTQLGIVAAIAASAITIWVASRSGATGSPRSDRASGITEQAAPTASAPSTEQEVNALLSGIPQTANVLGRPQAPVTLVWFGDLECPFCRRFTLGALPSIIQAWVRSGKLRVEYRSLETATREPEIFKTQQVAALAAGEQHKLWNFVETFYHEQGEEDSGYVTEEYLEGIANQVHGLDPTQWAGDRSNPELVAEVVADGHAAEHYGFQRTPSFLIGLTGETMTPRSFDSLRESTPYSEAIKELLERTRSRHAA